MGGVHSLVEFSVILSEAEAESKNPVAQPDPSATGFLDFARNDTKGVNEMMNDL